MKDVTFARDTMLVQTLSVQHYRVFMEQNFGSPKKLLQALDASAPEKAAALRREMEELAVPYFFDNALRQDYLLTRGVKM